MTTIKEVGEAMKEVDEALGPLMKATNILEQLIEELDDGANAFDFIVVNAETSINRAIDLGKRLQKIDARLCQAMERLPELAEDQKKALEGFKGIDYVAFAEKMGDYLEQAKNNLGK